MIKTVAISAAIVDEIKILGPTKKGTVPGFNCFLPLTSIPAKVPNKTNVSAQHDAKIAMVQIISRIKKYECGIIHSPVEVN
jgi:hypothetical protein